MMAFYTTTTTTTTSSFRSTTTIHSRCSFTLLFAVLLSTLAVNSNNAFVNADTIFSEIMPTKCVNPALNKAGFCVLTHECTTTRGCFESSNVRQPTSTTANTNRLSLDIDGFYVPVDAVDCEQFEDPICPSTTCCPECQVELNELYKCFIMETVGLNYLDYLASTCPLDCIGFESGSESSGNGPVPVTTIAPVPVASSTAPVPVPVTTIAPVSVPVATTIAPVPVLTTIVPVPVPVATTIAPVPVVTAAPFYTIGLVDPDTSNSTTYLDFGELIVDGEDDVVFEEVIVEEIIASSNITTSEEVKIGSVANDIP